MKQYRLLVKYNGKILVFTISARNKKAAIDMLKEMEKCPDNSIPEVSHE